MPEVIKKVRARQDLRKEARRASEFATGADGSPLRVFAADLVKTGITPDVTEQINGVSVVWVRVETLDEKREGFVSARFLAPEEEDIPREESFQPFAKQPTKEAFATTCYLQALQTGTNAAYLYAAAFALTGSGWDEKNVKAPQTVGATALGVFQMTQATWDRLRTDPAALDLLADDVHFPTAQCVGAALLAARSTSLLGGLITDRPVAHLDLFLAHLFADDGSEGSNAAARILSAEKADKTQSIGPLISQNISDQAARDAFLARTTALFAGGTVTIEEGLKRCVAALDAGFADLRTVAAAMAPITGGAGGIPINVTDEDIEALARVSHSEVGGFVQFGEPVLKSALGAVVDTIFNRVVYHTTEFPKTIQGVINQPSQFSAIKENQTWRDLTQATPTNRKIVLEHVQARADGTASEIKGATHFFNPDTSHPSWGEPIRQNPIKTYGVVGNRHIHGFPNGYRAPSDYVVAFGGRAFAFTGDGQPKSESSPENMSAGSLVAAAFAEWEAWGRSVENRVTGKTRIAHRDDEIPFATYVRDTYCKVLNVAPPLHDIANDEYAWSAVTISCFIDRAGIPKSAFTRSQRHSTYIREAIKARRDDDKSKAYWGFRFNEAPLAIGDIIGCTRSKDLTPAESRAFFDKQEDYESHADLVVAVRQGQADVIGGNVSDSVTMKTIALDQEGKIAGENHHWFVVMKKRA